MKQPKYLLFPSSFDSVRRVDEDLKSEYDAACGTELFDIILFDYNEWFNKGSLKLNQYPADEVCAIYRGWMMKPEQYSDFYKNLLALKIELITAPEAYKHLHSFPDVYPEIADDTAPIQLFPLHEQIPVEKVKLHFSKFIVKDYVKSVKGTEFPAFFDQTITQEQFDQWMEVFYKYRGDLLTSGICIKEYLNLKRYGARTNEYRVFYANHCAISVCRNSGQIDTVPDLPKAMIDQYSRLPSPFYTVDFGELEDGTWKILETGDGGVSGPSDGQNLMAFYRSLFYAFLN